MDELNHERALARVGSVIDDKYELKGLVGCGAAGAVYRGWHRFLGRDVAVKMLHHDLLHSTEHVTRFLRESRMASALRHPNIVTVFDGGRLADGTPYLVQEFLVGEDMGTAMERGRVALSDIFEISLQLLLALTAAHEAGIVHRDVKPENVFLEPDGRGGRTVKLVDFGIGKRALLPGDPSFMTSPGIAVGTPYYMSPEQARAQPVDARSDVWAVGALLFHALTGKPPFDADTADEVLVKIVSEDAPRVTERRSDLPEWLGEVVARALSQDRDLRFASAEAMAEAVRKRGGR